MAAFATQQAADTLVCLTDSNDNPIIAYKSDRTFTNIIFSSPDISETTYHLYTGGTIEGTVTNGVYTSITGYTGGTQQSYSGAGQGSPGGQSFPGGPGGNTPPDGGTPPDGSTPPDGGTPPEGSTPPDGQSFPGNNEASATPSTEFTVTANQHTFSGVTST